MRILIIEHEFPYPIMTGRRLRTWSFINALAKDHSLSLLCLDRHGASETLIDNIKQIFEKIWVVRPDKTRKKTKPSRLQNLIDIFKGVPWDITSVFSCDLEKKLLEIIDNNDFDVVFCRYIYVAQYIFRNRKRIKGRIFIDLDDIETLKWKRTVVAGIIKFKGVYDRLRYFINYKTFERYHKRLKLVDGCFVCSQKDRDYVFAKRWSKNVVVVPNSIQVSQYKDISDYEMQVWKNKVILFCGNLSYQPNIEGVIWFSKEVLPLIKKSLPDVKLHIVGLNPYKTIYPLVDNKSVFLFPNVPSVAPYYEQSSIVVAPIWVAGGTRIKILEAFACRRPVIATTIGAEGLGTEDGKHCLISNDPAGFASCCTLALSDFNLAAALVKMGYDFVVTNYDAEGVQALIREVFCDAKS